MLCKTKLASHLPPTRMMPPVPAPATPASRIPSRNWSRAWLVKHTQLRRGEGEGRRRTVPW